jgi:hypothetical protein
LARGRRLADLEINRLVLHDEESGQRTTLSVPSRGELVGDGRYDLVVVAVRSEQLASTLPIPARHARQHRGLILR